MRKIGMAVAVMAAAGTLAASPAPAQERQMPGKMEHQMPGNMEQKMQGMMEGMKQEMQDMMAVHAYLPAMLLEQKAELELTRDQVSKLEKLAAEVETAKTHAKTEHDARHAKIMAQFKLARPDPATVKTDAQEAMMDMAAAHGIELSAAAQAKGLLTDAQRAKLDAQAAMHGEMKDGMPGAGEHPRH